VPEMQFWWGGIGNPALLGKISAGMSM